ncbi:MAG TPA: hypothetical protein VN886_17955 [Acidimicrobiales bacterium]|nr:hypothetical protein [Acidimicrobiales bacterium]
MIYSANTEEQLDVDSAEDIGRYLEGLESGHAGLTDLQKELAAHLPSEPQKVDPGDFEEYGTEALAFINAVGEMGAPGAAALQRSSELDHDKLTLALAIMADKLVAMLVKASRSPKDKVMGVLWGPAMRDNFGKADDPPSP